ncbi:MAG: DUF6265 family protein [Planctomycetota bacterium]
MPRHRSIAIASLVLLACWVRLPASQEPASRTLHLDDFTWMVGGFEMVQGKVRVEEYWIPAAGKTMMGVSRTIQGDRTTFFEFLRLEERSDGIYYIAHPKAAAGTEFKLTQGTMSSAVFENPKHDHPKIIRYMRASDSSLVAEIEGDEGGKRVVERFDYRPIEKD